MKEMHLCREMWVTGSDGVHSGRHSGPVSKVNAVDSAWSGWDVVPPVCAFQVRPSSVGGVQEQDSFCQEAGHGI